MADRYKLSSTAVEDLDDTVRQVRLASRTNNCHKMLEEAALLRQIADRLTEEAKLDLGRSDEATHRITYHNTFLGSTEQVLGFYGTDAEARKQAKEISQYHSKVRIIRLKDGKAVRWHRGQSR